MSNISKLSNQISKSRRKSVHKSRRKSARKSRRKSGRKSRRKSGRKSSRKFQDFKKYGEYSPSIHVSSPIFYITYGPPASGKGGIMDIVAKRIEEYKLQEMEENLFNIISKYCCTNNRSE